MRDTCKLVHRTFGWLCCAICSCATALCALAGCEVESGPAWRDPPPGNYGEGPAVLGVIATDYASTALSLVDLPTGRVSKRAVLHSGSKLPQGLTALSGDVVLGRGTPGSVVLVDRARAVVTVVAADSGAVTRQFNVASGFYANPSDAQLLEGSWWVPRAARNAAGSQTADPNDDGDDLLWLAADGMQVEHRLGLSEHCALPGGVAAPQQQVVTDASVWLALGSFATDFRAQGTGRLLQIDRKSRALTASVDLAPWKNCVSAAASLDALYVVCMGSFADGPAAQLAGSAVLAVSTTAPHSVEVLATAASLGGDPLGAALAIADKVVFVQTMGSFAPLRPDRLWALPLAGGPPQPAGVMAAPFALGGLVWDTERSMLWAARRDVQGDLLRFYLVDGQLQALPPLAAMPGGLRATVLGMP